MSRTALCPASSRWSADATILMTQGAWTSPDPPAVCLDSWTSAYQAIDD
jgi:hypothetical protein